MLKVEQDDEYWTVEYQYDCMLMYEAVNAIYWEIYQITSYKCKAYTLIANPRRVRVNLVCVLAVRSSQMYINAHKLW